MAAARHSGLLGVPAIAACLATPSPAAPLAPAAAAAVVLVERALACLRSTGGYPQASNFPRAHFPFPTRGRWALGREVGLPPPLQAAAGAALAHEWAAADCWALGEEGAWQRPGGSGGEQPTPGPAPFSSEQEAYGALRRAFCEGDMVLCLNVPPTWAAGGAQPGGSRAFAATRPGVLWHCYQVAAEQGSSSSSASGSSWGGSSSWSSSEQDLYGRSLPRQGFGGQGSGAFVQQDNTAKVVAGLGRSYSPPAEAQALGPEVLPEAFILRAGTLLNDHAVGADVEAVTAGRAAVSAVQTWPAGHPFSLTDALLVWALSEGDDGMPAWL